MTSPFPLIESALKEALEAIYPPASGHIGGDLSYTAGDELYVAISLVPGSGQADLLGGSWALDVECFGSDYSTADGTGAMDHALAIEALLLPGRLRAPETGLFIDKVYQNSGPADRPWDDDSSFRVGATYVLTARRSS